MLHCLSLFIRNLFNFLILMPFSHGMTFAFKALRRNWTFENLIFFQNRVTSEEEKVMPARCPTIRHCVLTAMMALALLGWSQKGWSIAITSGPTAGQNPESNIFYSTVNPNYELALT